MTLSDIHRVANSLDLPTLVDCGCRAYAWRDNSGIEIEYCSKHKAAPDLLEALKEIAKGEGAFSPDRLKHTENTLEHLVAIAEQAIAKAEGVE